MDVSQISGVGTPKAADTSRAKLADNFDTFLTLLTAQLQNQDPLSPMEANEFTQQLVQFSSVEQAIQSNKHLEQLLAQSRSDEQTRAVGYLGKRIEADGAEAPLVGGSAQWRYTLPADATTTLTVQDANGAAVFNSSGATKAGQHGFTWDGRQNGGGTAPEGAYKLQITARDKDGKTIAASTSVSGIVNGVESKGGQTHLLLGSTAVPLGNVTKVQNPPS